MEVMGDMEVMVEVMEDMEEDMEGMAMEDMVDMEEAMDMDTNKDYCYDVVDGHCYYYSTICLLTILFIC